jgi:hypothetical protein
VVPFPAAETRTRHRPSGAREARIEESRRCPASREPQPQPRLQDHAQAGRFAPRQLLANAAIATTRCLLPNSLGTKMCLILIGGCVMEHRGVRYEIKIAPGRSQWTWVVHISPKPKQGSVEGPRRVAVLAAEKTIDRWWYQRHRLNAARVMRGNGGLRSLPE